MGNADFIYYIAEKNCILNKKKILLAATSMIRLHKFKYSPLVQLFLTGGATSPINFTNQKKSIFR